MEQPRFIINLRQSSAQKQGVFGLLMLCLIIISIVLGYTMIQFPLAFLIPIGLGIGIAILLNPIIGLLILVFGIIFPSGIFIPNTPLTVMKIVGALTLTGWATKSLLRQKKEFKIDNHLIVVVLFLVWALFSVIWAQYRQETIQATESLMWTIVFYFLVLVMVDSRLKCEMVVYVLIFSGTVASLAGFILPTDLLTGRIGGLVGNSNYLAPGFVVSAIMGLGLILSRKRRLIKFLSAVALIIVLMGLFYTMSLRGLLGLVVSLILLLFLEREKRRHCITLIMIMAAIGFFFAPQELWERLSIEFIRTNVRQYLWRTAFIVFLKHPLTGIGFGNFLHSFSEFKWLTRVSLGAYWYRSHSMAVVHNTYLSIMSELGIVGIIFFTVIISLSLKKLFVARSIFKSEKNISMYHLTNFNIASLAGLLSVLSFGSHFGDLYLWLLLGLSVAIGRIGVRLVEDKEMRVAARSVKIAHKRGVLA